MAQNLIQENQLNRKAAADALNARLEQLSQAIKLNSAEAERSLGQLALSTTEAIRASAGNSPSAKCSGHSITSNGFSLWSFSRQPQTAFRTKRKMNIN